MGQNLRGAADCGVMRKHLRAAAHSHVKEVTDNAKPLKIKHVPGITVRELEQTN